LSAIAETVRAEERIEKRKKDLRSVSERRHGATACLEIVEIVARFEKRQRGIRVQERGGGNMGMDNIRE